MKKLVAIVAMVLVLGACTDGKPKKEGAQKQGQRLTESAFEQQSKAVPYPVEQLKDSLERRNVRERLLRTNDPAKVGYVYLMSFGKVIGYYSVKGKVSSTQSQLTTTHLLKESGYAESRSNAVYDAPGDDGSYGPNEDGVFFFTTEGVMVTTSLDYIWSDQPLPIDTPRLNSKK